MSGAKKTISNARIEELVRKSQKGDSKAFAELYDVFVPQIYKYIYYKVKKEDVEDLTETLFLKAWENIRMYKKRSKTNFRSWIYRIAHNLVVDHYRLSREHVPLDTDILSAGGDSNPKETAHEKLNNENLKKAITKLKKPYQQIIILKFINELSNREISVILKKSEGNVRILQFRALKALRQILFEMGIEYVE